MLSGGPLKWLLSDGTGGWDVAGNVEITV